MLGGLAQSADRILPRTKPAKGSGKTGIRAQENARRPVHITEEQYEEAVNEEPKLVHKQNPHARVASDFVEHVRRYVVQKYGWDALNKEGLQVYTTVDLDLDQGRARGSGRRSPGAWTSERVIGAR